MKKVAVLIREKLEEEIVKRNLTKKEFAEKAGLSPVYFSSMMNPIGECKPSPQTRKQILDALSKTGDKAFVFDDIFIYK